MKTTFSFLKHAILLLGLLLPVSLLQAFPTITHTAINGTNLNWNSTTTWVQGTVPGTNSVVRIPSGSIVRIPVGANIHVSDILVNGKLRVTNGATSLRTQTVLVSGNTAIFEVGTSTTPITTKFTIFLDGTDPARNIDMMGTKYIVSQNGGTITMFGKHVEPFRTLNTTLNAGSNQLKVQNVSTWKSGDSLMVTATAGPYETDWHLINRGTWEQRENFTINSLSAASGEYTVNLNRNATYDHISTTKSYTRTLAPARTWSAKTAGYVANKSRYIRIEGVDLGDGFGGHVMVHGANPDMGLTAAGKAYIENVEFYRMGQKGKLGRYPFHWHMLHEEGTGQYIRNCSIHTSFNRGIVIHGTYNVELTANSVIDVMGHAVFQEDGAEINNVITGNLVVNATRPAAGDELVPSDNSDNDDGGRSPAAFWISHPQNTYNNNVATSSPGSGFWFALHVPTGLSASDPRFDNIPNARTAPVVSFDGNSANTLLMGIDMNDTVSTTTMEVLNNHPWKPATRQELANFTGWGNRMTIYSGLGTEEGKVVLYRPIILDNQQAIRHASRVDTQEALIAAAHDNRIYPTSEASRVATLYDGGARFLNSHYVNFGTAYPLNSIITPQGGADPMVNWYFSGSSFNHTGYPNLINHSNTTLYGTRIFIDADGTLGGRVGSFVSSADFVRQSNDVNGPANWQNLRYSLSRFARILMQVRSSASDAGDVTFGRFHRISGELVNATDTGTRVNRLAQVICDNSDFQYNVIFEKPAQLTSLTIRYEDGNVGDSTVFRFMGIGSYNKYPTGMVSASSLANLRSSTINAYYDAGADLYIKTFAEGRDGMFVTEITF